MASDETWHHGIIAAACEVYAVPRYLEIGVGGGACLEAVGEVAVAIGVDPVEPSYKLRGVEFVRATSDEYLETYEGAPFDVIFIDGDHAYEQARRDLDNALRVLTPAGVVFLHDTHPLSAVDTRLRVACGDVYRLRRDLEVGQAGFGQVEVFTWTRFPGLTMVRRRVSIQPSDVVV